MHHLVIQWGLGKSNLVLLVSKKEFGLASHGSMQGAMQSCWAQAPQMTGLLRCMQIHERVQQIC